MKPCLFWHNNRKCYKGQKCQFLHSEKTDKGKFTIEQLRYSGTPGKYHYSPPDMRKRSPTRFFRKSRSPIKYGRRSRSPRRYSRSPGKYSRSPRRHSPRRYSRSPRRFSRSPRRFSRSPKRFSHSPRRFSRSPKKYSKSPGRYNYSPAPYQQGNVDIQDNLEWIEGNSPMPPPDIRLSPAGTKNKQSYNFAQDEMYNNLEFENKSPLMQNVSQSLKAENKEDHNIVFENVTTPKSLPVDSPPKSFSPNKNKADLENLLQDNEGEVSMHEHMDFSPSRAIDMIKRLPVDFFNFTYKSSDENATVEEADHKNPIGFNVNDSVTFAPPLKKPEATLPPVTRHSDEALRLGLPLPHKLFPVNNDPPARRDQTWTPAMDRNKTKSFNLPLVSNWEVDTPYISRNSTHAMPGPSVTAHQVRIKDKDRRSPPKRKTSDSRKKKKRKRKASSSSSSSDSDGPTPSKAPSGENILNKKKAILAKVWTLMEQKKKLDAQKEEILFTHKSDNRNLPTILSENAFLSKEIDKQIFVMNEMIQRLNEQLGVSVMDSHQQEFYLRSNLLREDRNGSGSKSSAPKFPVVGYSEKLVYAEKFLKPTDAPKSSEERKTKKHEDKQKKKNLKQKDKIESPPRKSRKNYSKNIGTAEIQKESYTDSKPWQEVYKDAAKSKVNDKEVHTKKPISDEEYAPSANLKPHVKYIDQGMHWCALCTEFSESVTDFITHLQSSNHITKLKTDKKKWLPKYVSTVKQKAQKGAPVLTIPLQGVEFMHSITGYYCSLCELLVKSSEEANDHAETKIHVSKYKEYLSKNPMYETTYIKDKMAAFAKYSVEKEKRKTNETFFSKRGETIPPLSKKGPLPKPKSNPITIPPVRETKPFFPDAEKQSDIPKPTIVTKPSSVSDVKPSSVSDVKPSSVSDVKPSSVPDVNLSSVPDVKPSFISDVKPSSVPDVKKIDVVKEIKTIKPVEDEKVCSIRVASRASKLIDEKQSIATEIGHIKPAKEVPGLPINTLEKEPDYGIQIDKQDTSKLNTLRKKVGLAEGNSDSDKKIKKKMFSNVMIGKMPFLKRNRRELIITREKRELTDVASTETKTVHSETILPLVIPKNLEYITEIESFGTETKFTKVIGPTFPNSDNDSDMEIEQVALPDEEVKAFHHVDDSNSSSKGNNAHFIPNNENYYQPQTFSDYSTPPPFMPYQHARAPLLCTAPPPSLFNTTFSSQYHPPMQNYSSVHYNQMDNSNMHYYPVNIPQQTNENRIEARANTPPPPGTEKAQKRVPRFTAESPGSLGYTTDQQQIGIEFIPSDVESSSAATVAKGETNLIRDIPVALSTGKETAPVFDGYHDNNHLSVNINVQPQSILTLMEAIVQEQTEAGSLASPGQNSGLNLATEALSEELIHLESIQDKPVVLSPNQNSEVDKEVIPNNEACPASPGQNACLNLATEALSEELIRVESIQDKPVVLPPNQKSEVDKEVISNNEACMEENYQEEQILEGLLLLDGAESSDDSSE